MSFREITFLEPLKKDYVSHLTSDNMFTLRASLSTCISNFWFFTKLFNENASSETASCEARSSSSCSSVRRTSIINWILLWDLCYGGLWLSSFGIQSHENVLLILSERRVTRRWGITRPIENHCWKDTLSHKVQKQMIYWQRGSEWRSYYLQAMWSNHDSTSLRLSFIILYLIYLYVTLLEEHVI